MPTSKEDAFQQLALMTDAAATDLAKKIARHTRAAGMVDQLDDELRKELAAAFGPPDATGGGEAAAARAALVLAADTDPAAVVAYTTAAEAQGVLASIAVMTAALVILQTEVKIARDANGKWTVAVHKRASSDGLLTAFVKAVLGMN